MITMLITNLIKSVMNIKLRNNLPAQIWSALGTETLKKILEFNPLSLKICEKVINFNL